MKNVEQEKLSVNSLGVTHLFFLRFLIMQLDTINKLKLWEVLDYYDDPQFYSCKDVTGQIYIVFWADVNEGNDYWLYLKVSPKRYLALKNGRLPIRDVLGKPEEGIVYLVIKGNDIFDLKVLSSEQIDQSWLPEPDDYL